MADNSNRIPFRQLLLQYSNTALNIIFPLILFPYMTRTLGPSGYGVIGFYESLMLVVNVWAAFGVNYYGLRLLSKSAIGDTDHSNTVLHLLLINTIMAISGVVVYLVYVFTKPIPVSGFEITLLYAFIMVIYMYHLDWYFQSQEKYKFLLQRTFFLRLFVLASALFFVRRPEHLIYYIIISTVNYTLIAGSAFWQMRNVFSHWRWDPNLFRRLLIALSPFALLGVLGSLYFTIDTILLARTGDITSLGHYTVAAKMVRLGLNVFIAASIVFFVRLFRTAVDKQLQADSMLMTLHLSIPIGAMLFFFAQPIILFISGESYLPAVSILRIFSILWVIVPLHDFFNIQVLMVHHREKLLVRIYLAATLISLILNLVLIPIWFTAGAATAVVISETFVLFAGIWFSRPYFRMSKEMGREMIFCATAFPVAFIAWKLTTQMQIGVLWQLLTGTSIFLAGYLFLQVVIIKNAFLLRMQHAIKRSRA